MGWLLNKLNELNPFKLQSELSFSRFCNAKCEEDAARYKSLVKFLQHPKVHVRVHESVAGKVIHFILSDEMNTISYTYALLSKDIPSKEYMKKFVIKKLTDEVFKTIELDWQENK